MCPPLSRRDNELAVCDRLPAANRSHPTISLIVPIRPDRAASLLTPSAASPVLLGTRPLFLYRSSLSFKIFPTCILVLLPFILRPAHVSLWIRLRIYSDTPAERLPPMTTTRKHIHPSPIFLRKTTQLVNVSIAEKERPRCGTGIAHSRPRTSCWKKENAMDWDLLLVTGALIGVFMLIALLGRIWRDQTPHTPKSETKESHEFAAASCEAEKVA